MHKGFLEKGIVEKCAAEKCRRRVLRRDVEKGCCAQALGKSVREECLSSRISGRSCGGGGCKKHAC